MEKIISLLIDNKWIKISLIILLAIFWIFSSLLFVSPVSFTTLTFRQNADLTTNTHNKKMLKGSYIQGEFKAKEDNLGIIFVQLSAPNVSYDDQDTLIFQIKELGSKSWLYKNTYRSGLMSEVHPFPLGFPSIQESKGKTYEFKITSLSGDDLNAVSLYDKYVYVSYKMSKSQLLDNKNELVYFLITKFVTSFTRLDFLLTSTIYLIPLLIYLCFLVSLRFSFALKYLILLIFILGFLDVVISKEVITSFYVCTALIWLLISHRYKLSGEISFFFSFFILSLSMIFLFAGNQVLATKISSYAYIFLVMGVLQLIYDERSKSGVRVDLQQFFRMLLNK